MKKWSQPIGRWPVRPVRLRPELVRKFTMGLVVRQGCPAGQERYLFRGPVAPPCRAPAIRLAALPGEFAALGFPLVGLDPDGHVDKVRGFPPGRAGAFEPIAQSAGSVSVSVKSPSGALPFPLERNPS